MKPVRLIAVALFAVFVSAGLAWAAKMPEPKVDYSADMVMEMEQGTMKAKVYHSPGKQRMEMGEQGGMATIVRRDKKVMWQVMPGGMYMEMPINENDANDLHNMDVQHTVVGDETVNGMKTTKHKVIATTKDGKKFGGFFWLTKDDIAVKSDMLLKEGNQQHRIAFELQNLKVGKQSPQLFEVPPGYTKNDMGAFMGRGRPGQGDAPIDKDQIERMMKEMRGR